MVFQVNDKNFEKEVLQADKPVLVEFYANWCAPCKAMAPYLDGYAGQKEKTLKAVKLDVEEAVAVASKYDIRSLPTLMVFRNGVPIAKTAGVKNETQINFIVESALALDAGAKIGTDARTRQQDKEEADVLRKTGSKILKFAAMVKMATGLYEVLGGGILAAASGGLVTVPGLALGCMAACK